MVREDAVLLPIHADYGVLMRNSRIQLYRDEQRPSSMITSSERMMVLNSELESMNNLCVLIVQVVQWIVESQYDSIPCWPIVEVAK